MEEFKYPMWFKDKDTSLVVEFDSIDTGKVVVGCLNFKKGHYSTWDNHNLSGWVDVTDQYKEKQESDKFITVLLDETKLSALSVPYNVKETQRPKVAHYQRGGIEPIDFINSHNFNFNIGNCIKYCSRAGRKGDALEDLQKAIDYLNFEIERLNNA